jgi:hypothetical protein
MAKTARERLARLLDDSAPGGSFSAQLLAPAHLLRLEVTGVGPVSLPVRAPQAKQLIAVARPAMFGRGEETLTDAKVRDTWEITPDQIRLGGPGWTALMDSALEHFRDELGLPPATRLRAEPHSMLVYGKGQFFLPHQDSEKDDAMAGTLVVSLPSAHTGGELVVGHAGESKAYRVSKEELTFVAFYADCRHEVTPVRSGCRVTLAFNLLSGDEAPAQAAGPVTELAHCLTEHFTTPVTPRYGGLDLDPPNRLVYLLDHEYTERGLKWNRLKGVDRERAALLRAAAERAGCEAVLALAEVKETWNAVVVWPLERAFAARAEAGSRWALSELHARIEAGDLERARTAAESLAPFWKTIGSQAGLLDTALHVAAGLGAAGTAAMLLEPFRVETVAPEHAGGLAAVAGQYGEEWTRGVADGWFGPEHHVEPGRHEWVERLPWLCEALHAAGAPDVARLLAAGAWRWMGDQLRLWTTAGRTEVRQVQLQMLGSPLVRLLEAADDNLRDEIVAVLRESGDNVLACLMPALRSAAALPAAARRAAGLDLVARDCAGRLGAIIARPLRGADDWSIEWSGCGCDLCEVLGTFLGSRSRRSFEWPLAKDGRRHVHTQIDSAELPVRHQTQRQGRPYTLMLTKTGELFTRQKDARRNAVTDLTWLRSAWGDGSPGTSLPCRW